MRRPRRLGAVTVPTAAAYLISGAPWAPIIICILLIITAMTFASLLLAATWSCKEYRRESAYGLVKLIIESRRP
jgi:cell division protein FtsW (lipid II flippase)